VSPRCWFCSEEIRSAERAKVVADLSVLVHVGCFDRLYETDGVKPWSSDRPGPSRSSEDDEA
jgi:hypothetical protein